MARWPQWRLTDDVRAVFQPDAGLCAASRCNAAHRRLAVEHAADLRDRSPVTAIEERGGEIELATPSGRITCRTLVVAADSWTNDVLRMLGVRPLPLTITKEQVVYFGAPDPDRFSPERFPIWIWMDDPSFYGFPAFGEPGPKAGQDVGGETDDPSRARRRAGRGRIWVGCGPSWRTPPGGGRPDPLPPDVHVHDAAGSGLRHRPVARTPNVILLLGAAHGFKFASLFGRIAAELATSGRSEHDLSHFRVDREVLTMEDPPRSFMV